MVDYFHVSTEQAGLLAAVHLAGAAIGSFISILLIALLGQRRLLVFAVFCFVMGESLFVFSGYLPAMHIGRLIAGFGCGVFVALAFANVASLNQKDSIYAFLLLCQMIFGFIGALLWPQILGTLGYVGAMLALAVMAILTLPFLRMLPAHLTGETVDTASKAVLTIVAVVSLLSLFTHYIANSMLWVYLERIGVEGGLSIEEISSSLAVSMLWGIFGTILAMVLGRLKSRFPQITIGILGIMVGTAMLLTHFDSAMYTFSISLILMTMVFTIPFYQGFIADLENGEQLAMLAACAINIGLAFGPMLGSQVISYLSFQAMLWFCIIVFGMAQILISVAFYRARST